LEFPWKPNWLETRRHFVDWWEGRGMLAGCWVPPRAAAAHVPVPPFEKDPDFTRFHRDPLYHAQAEHARLAWDDFGGDTLPLAETDIGPGSLALYLGSQAGFAKDTVWFKPWMESIHQPIRFDPSNPWWQTSQATLQAQVRPLLDAVGPQGMYLMIDAACPDELESVLAVTASFR